MPIPTHGPFCQTLVYDTSCWYCQQTIFVLQCSCGSAVLLDAVGLPWPKHACAGVGGAGGIGGSGLGGWTAVDALRAQGASITPDIMAKVFPGHGGSNRNIQSQTATKRIEPERGRELPLLAVVRELNRDTRRTKEANALPDLGIKLLGLDSAIRYRQITLVDNSVRPNESYTALVPDGFTRGLWVGAMVMAEMRGRVAGDFAVWVVVDINLL